MIDQECHVRRNLKFLKELKNMKIDINFEEMFSPLKEQMGINIKNDPTAFKGTVKEFFEESAKIILESE